MLKESYDRAYSGSIVRLHQLFEAELVIKAFGDGRRSVAGSGGGGGSQKEAAEEALRLRLRGRLGSCDGALSTREPILSLHSALASLAFGRGSAQAQGAESWLQIGCTARKTAKLLGGGSPDVLSSAAAALMNVHPSKQGSAFHIEKAKLLWAQGNQQRALVEVNEQLLRVGRAASGNTASASASAFGSGSGGGSGGMGAAAAEEYDENVHAKLMLLSAKFSAATGRESAQEIVSKYKLVSQTVTGWDKPHCHLGVYLDRIYSERKAAAEAGGEADTSGAVSGAGHDVSRKRPRHHDSKSTSEISLTDVLEARRAPYMLYGAANKDSCCESLTQLLLFIPQ